MRTRRCILCLVACAASVLATQWADAQVAAEPDVKPRKPPDTKTGNPAPEVQLERLGPRPPAGQTADPFQARSWAPPASPTPPQRRTTVKREPPPLPFTYLGRIVDGDATVVMLARENVSFVVRLGDTLERDYRVSRIGDEGITLHYLPLNVDQTLSYSAAAPAAAAGPPAAPRPSAGGRDDRRRRVPVKDERCDSQDGTGEHEQDQLPWRKRPPAARTCLRRHGRRWGTGILRSFFRRGRLFMVGGDDKVKKKKGPACAATREKKRAVSAAFALRRS